MKPNKPKRLRALSCATLRAVFYVSVFVGLFAGCQNFASSPFGSSPETLAVQTVDLQFAREFAKQKIDTRADRIAADAGRPEPTPADIAQAAREVYARMAGTIQFNFFVMGGSPGEAAGIISAMAEVIRGALEAPGAWIRGSTRELNSDEDRLTTAETERLRALLGGE